MSAQIWLFTQELSNGVSQVIYYSAQGLAQRDRAGRGGAVVWPLKRGAVASQAVCEAENKRYKLCV